MTYKIIIMFLMAYAIPISLLTLGLIQGFKQRKNEAKSYRNQ